LPIPIDLEPGTYALSIVLYDAETLGAYRTWTLSSVGITPPELDR
jgi:hypothetical protein